MLVDAGLRVICRLTIEIVKPKISEKIWAASVRIANEPEIIPPINSPVMKHVAIPTEKYSLRKLRLWAFNDSSAASTSDVVASVTTTSPILSGLGEWTCCFLSIL